MNHFTFHIPQNVTQWAHTLAIAVIGASAGALHGELLRGAVNWHTVGMAALGSVAVFLNKFPLPGAAVPPPGATNGGAAR